MASYFVVQKPLLLSGRIPPLTVTAYVKPSPFTSLFFFVTSRALMGCANPPMTGVFSGTPHQCPLDVALCRGIYADVRYIDASSHSERYAYGFGAMQLLAVLLVAVPWWELKTWVITSETGQALIFAVLMNSCFKYAMLSIVNVKLSVSTITLSGTLVPVLCAVGDYLMFGEVVLFRHYVGCALILLGLAESTGVAAGWRRSLLPAAAAAAAPV